MEKALRIVVVIIISLTVYSCSEQSSIHDEKQNVKFNDVKSEVVLTKPKTICHAFTIGVNIGIFYVDTEITICCTLGDGIYVCLPHRANGNPNETGYDFTQIFKDAGITEDINSIEIVNSNTVVFEDGTKVSVNPGIYSVDKDNFVHLTYDIK